MVSDVNRYDHTFSAVCPSDGAAIIYHLTIATDEVIMAERIVKACRFDQPQFHEALANNLAKKFSGEQTLTAMHQGVHITTTRKGPPYDK